MSHVIVTVDYVFYGPAGDQITARVLGEAFDSGDKAGAKAMSVAFRTALLQALSLPTDESDPDHASYEREAAPVKAMSEEETQVALTLSTAVKDAENVEDLRFLWSEIRSAGLPAHVRDPLLQLVTTRQKALSAT